MPAPLLMSRIKKFFDFLVPGVQFDVGAAGKDQVLALLGGTVLILRIDEPGQEPNMMESNFHDETIILKEFSGAIFDNVEAHVHSRFRNNPHHRRSTSPPIHFAPTKSRLLV